MGLFEGFLRSSKLFWPLKMVPNVARGHFGAKKVESSSKTPRKGPIMCFSQKKNYPKLVESAVHWYFYVPMAYILIQRAQKHHNLIEKPLEIADSVLPALKKLCHALSESANMATLGRFQGPKQARLSTQQLQSPA